MFIKKYKYNQLLDEISNAKNYIGVLECEQDIFKNDLIKSERRVNDLKAEVESLKKRLKHLLQSEHIRQYDEQNRKTHTYKKDISKCDEEFNKYKAAYEILLKCTNCNECKKAHKCEFVEWGDRVVYNCPHFESGENDD